MNIRGVELDSIEIYKFVRFEGSKLIAKADREKYLNYEKYQKFGNLLIAYLYQIKELKGLNEIEVRLLSNSDIDQTIVSSIKRILNYHLKDKIQIEIKRVNKLNYTAGGKLKPILNELNYKYIRQ